MKIRILFKTPDAIDYATSMFQVKLNTTTEEIDPKEQEKLRQTLDKFVEFNECILIELDTDHQTATVVPNGQ